MPSDAKRMITGTILFIFHVHLLIASDGGFWVESGGSLHFGVAREATNLYNQCTADRPAPPILFRIFYGCLCVCRRAFPPSVSQVDQRPPLNRRPTSTASLAHR